MCVYVRVQCFVNGFLKYNHMDFHYLSHVISIFNEHCCIYMYVYVCVSLCVVCMYDPLSSLASTRSAVRSLGHHAYTIQPSQHISPSQSPLSATYTSTSTSQTAPTHTHTHTHTPLARLQQLKPRRRRRHTHSMDQFHKLTLVLHRELETEVLVITRSMKERIQTDRHV